MSASAASCARGGTEGRRRSNPKELLSSAPTLTIGGGVEGSATRHFRARHSPDWFTRLFSLFAPCFSLLSPFFSLFRGDSGLENPPKTVCLQMVGQKAPSRAEQDHNREIIRAYQGGNREITGGEQAPRDSAGSSRMRRHSAPIQPLEMWRLEPPTPSRPQDRFRFDPARGGSKRQRQNTRSAASRRTRCGRIPKAAS
jgi:hypothetical protein